MNKIRQRYLIFEILCEDTTSFSDQLVIRTIWQKINQIFGEIVAFKTGLWLITWDDAHNKGILRLDHFVDSEVITALSFIQEIKGNRVIFHTRKTTGTIKKAKTLWQSIFDVPLPAEKKDHL